LCRLVSVPIKPLSTVRTLTERLPAQVSACTWPRGVRAHGLQSLGGGNEGLALQRAPDDVDQRTDRCDKLPKASFLTLPSSR
jgi:hypothetical protein